MAKFRMNHARKGNGAGGNIIRVGIFAALISGLFFVFEWFTGEAKSAGSMWSNERITPADTVDDRSYYLPSTHLGVAITHDYYSLSYVREHKQAEWVAYMLTRSRLEKTLETKRPSGFTKDPKLLGRGASDTDYKNSGYDRGHLVPAADMDFSEKALQASFYYGNISPQAHDFNTGIWLELETNVRSWAKRNKKIYVITGPILTEPGKGTIGLGVTIPTSFYKVILDLSEPGKKGIAFIIPNEITYQPLPDFVVSIDEVESRTGLNFFKDLMPEDVEKEIEAHSNKDVWPFSQSAHNRRMGR